MHYNSLADLNQQLALAAVHRTMIGQKMFKLKCGNQDFYLMTSNNNDGAIELILTDATNAWKGKVSQEELSAKSKDAGASDCATQSNLALSGECTEGFEFELKGNVNGKDSVQLIWKKIIEKDSIKFQLGSASLQPCDNPGVVIARAFDHLLDVSNALREQMAALQLDRDRLAAERSEVLKTLESNVSIKEDTEQSLYSKFVVVLNEKKEKIRSLKEQLRRMPEEKNKRIDSHRMEVDKRSAGHATSSEQECNTDEEIDNNRKSKVDCTTVTSSTKAAEDARRDRTTSGSQSPLSFMLDDPHDDDADDSPVVAKRGKKADVDNRKLSESEKNLENSRSDSEKDAPKGSKFEKIPCMLSWTGTTNTSTTSSDRQRLLDKSGSSKKETQKASSSACSENNMDDLIGDMA